MPVKKVESKVRESKNVILSEVEGSKPHEKDSSTAVGMTKKLAKNTNKEGSLTVPVYSLLGKEVGTMGLPKEIFGLQVNKTLLAQAVRIYFTNKNVHPGSTKTRGEVSLTTKKWFRQKGTGRARHGAQSAPIFVGGGVAMGPKPRKVRLDLPKKMKKAALIAALSARAQESSIVGISGLDKSTGKTKEFTNLVDKIASVENEQILSSGKKPKNKKSTLIVMGDKNDNVLRAVKNLPKVNALMIDNLNVFEVIKHEVLAITNDAVDKLAKKIKGEIV